MTVPNPITGRQLTQIRDDHETDGRDTRITKVIATNGGNRIVTIHIGNTEQEETYVVTPTRD